MATEFDIDKYMVQNCREIEELCRKMASRFNITGRLRIDGAGCKAGHAGGLEEGEKPYGTYRSEGNI